MAAAKAGNRVELLWNGLLVIIVVDDYLLGRRKKVRGETLLPAMFHEVVNLFFSAGPY